MTSLKKKIDQRSSSEIKAAGIPYVETVIEGLSYILTFEEIFLLLYVIECSMKSHKFQVYYVKIKFLDEFLPEWNEFWSLYINGFSSRFKRRICSNIFSKC